MKQGYIIDTPNVLIKTGDKAYLSLTATTGQIAVAPEEITIEGGQSVYPLFNMNTKSAVTVTLTDAQFNTDMFEAFGATASTGNRKRYELETSYVVPEGKSITITGRKIDPADMTINGLKCVAKEDQNVTPTVKTGFVKVDNTTADTNLEFNEDMVGKTITPIYAYEESSESLKFLEGVFPKKAEIILQFPLYEDEEGNGAKPATVQITVYKASIKASPTIGGNYKTASTFTIECTAMNPRRADKEIWAIDVFDNNETV